MRSRKTILAVSLAPVLILSSEAVDRPGLDEILKNADKSESVPTPLDARRQNLPSAEGGEIAWLGVSGTPVDETLSVQLDLDHGVVLKVISPESPAAQAGLQKNDILTQIQGQGVANQNALRDLVLEHQPGDEIKVTILRRGQANEKVVVLGAKKAQAQGHREAQSYGLEEAPEQLQDRFGSRNDRINQIHQEMEERMRRMSNLFGQGDSFSQLDDLKDMIPQGIHDHVKSFSTGSMMFKDGEHSFTLTTDENGSHLVAKDQSGKIVYDGPFNTDEDKASVPDQIRDKVAKMKTGGSTFRFSFGR